METKDLAVLATAKIEQREASQRAAREQAEQDARKAAERASQLETHLRAFEAEIAKVCGEAPGLSCSRTVHGFEVSLQDQKLRLEVVDVGDEEVDFWGRFSVQRWVRDFYVTRRGTFTTVTFSPTPGMRTRGEPHPSGAQELRQWVVDCSRALGVVQVQKVANSFPDPLKEAIAKTIELANL